MEDKQYEILEQKMCKELEMIEAKYRQNPRSDMDVQDLEKVDKLVHALKSLSTYKAMKEAEEYGEEGFSGYSGEGGNSGRRGRSPVTGRYVSRDGGASFADGYSRGYSEAMSQMSQAQGGNSGHYPMMNEYGPRRW